MCQVHDRGSCLHQLSLHYKEEETTRLRQKLNLVTLNIKTIYTPKILVALKRQIYPKLKKQVWLTVFLPSYKVEINTQLLTVRSEPCPYQSTIFKTRFTSLCEFSII